MPVKLSVPAKGVAAQCPAGTPWLS